MVAHYYIYSIIALKIYEQTLENAISEQNNTCLEKTVIFQIVHFFCNSVCLKKSQEFESI